MMGMFKVNEFVRSLLGGGNQVRASGINPEEGVNFAEVANGAEASSSQQEVIPVSFQASKKLNADLLQYMVAFLPQRALLPSRLTSKDLYQNVALTRRLILDRADRPYADPRGRNIAAWISLLASQAMQKLSVDKQLLQSNIWRSIQDHSINVHTLYLNFYGSNKYEYSLIPAFLRKFKHIHTVNITGEFTLDFAKINPDLCRTIKCLSINGRNLTSSDTKMRVLNFGEGATNFTALESLILEGITGISEQDFNSLSSNLVNLRCLKLAVMGQYIDLRHLAKLQNLADLMVFRGVMSDSLQITDEVLTVISQLPKLRTLKLSHVAYNSLVSFSIIAHAVKLRELSCLFTPISSKALNDIGIGCKDLEKLDLSCSDRCLTQKDFLVKFPNLTYLKLSGNPWVHNDWLVDMAISCPKLKEVDIGGSRVTSLESFLFPNFKDLVKISLYDTRIPDAEISRYRRLRPDVQLAGSWVS